MPASRAALLRAILTVGVLAAAPAALGLFTASPAAAQEDCNRYREGSSRQDQCLLRNARKMHDLNKKHRAECARGGCGKKARKIDQKRDRLIDKFEAQQD